MTHSQNVRAVAEKFGFREIGTDTYSNGTYIFRYLGGALHNLTLSKI